MTVPTVNVTVTVHDSIDGNPVAGAVIIATLDRQEVYQGFVVQEQYKGLTDVNGIAVVAVFPNELGSNSSRYRFRIVNPATQITDTYYATIPNAPVNLSDVIDKPPFPGRPDGQAAVDEAVKAKIAAEASALAAAASAEDALVSQLAAESARQNVAGSIERAAISEQVALEGEFGAYEWANEDEDVPVCVPNMLVYSESFNNAAWVTSANITVLPNQFTAVSNEVTADLIQLDDTGLATIRQNVTVAAGSSFSLFAQVASGSLTAFEVDHGGGTPQVLLTQLYAEKWIRTTAPALVKGVAGEYVEITLQGTAGAQVALWGAKLEESPTVTLYDKTTGAAGIIRYSALHHAIKVALHEARTDNPHGVTAAQALALALTGGTLTGPTRLEAADALARIEFNNTAALANTRLWHLWTNGAALDLTRYNDDLTGPITAFSVDQATGIVDFSGTPTVAGQAVHHAGNFNDALHGARGGGTQHAEATQTVAGFMSAADKAKLDSVSISGFSGVSLYRSANQNFAASTATPISWDTERFDVGGWHDLVTNPELVTIPAGVSYVMIIARLKWLADSTGSGLRSLEVLHNGLALGGPSENPIIDDPDQLPAGPYQELVTAIPVAPGDTLAISGYHSSTNTVNQGVDNGYTSLKVIKLG